MNSNWGMAWINTQTRLVLLIKFIPLKDIPDYRYLLIIKVARNSSSQIKHINHVTLFAISLRSNLELYPSDKNMPRSLRKRSSRKSYSEDVFAGVDSSEESECPGPGSTSALQQSSKSKIGVDSADDEDDDEYSFSAEDDAEVETENDDHDGENFEIDDIAIENKEIQSDTTHHELLDVPNDSNGALNSHSVEELEMYKENEQALADLIRTIEEHFQANVFELKDVIVGSFNGDGKTQDSTTVHITKTVKKRGRPRKYPISNTSTKEPSKSEAILPAPTSVSSSPLAPSESHPSLPEKQKHLVFPVDNTGKLTCPVQACKKVFASKAGFVYHLRNTPHNFLDFLAHAFPNSRIDAVSNTSNVMNKISSNPNSTEPLSIIATLPSTSILSNIEPSIVHMLLLVPIISYPLKVNTPPAVMPPPHGTSAKAVSYEVLFDIPDLPEDVVEPFKVLLEKPEYSSLKFYIEGQSVEAVIGESKYQTRNLRHAAERKSNRSTDQSKASLPHKPRGKPSRSKQPFSGQRNAELMCDCIDFSKPSDALKKPFWQLFESNPRLKEFKEDCKLKLRTDDIKILTKEERERASKMWTPRKVEVRNKSGIESRITEVGCMQSEQLPPSCSKGFLLNTGCSVWGLDWCPGVPSGVSRCIIISDERYPHRYGS
ncbi:hypothetical protein BKA69DRAFT_917949 [Paraphysoderma sedebokerense]|nr:hypothetical protein BKA69DRAFT_917949 [Paraphysoderma sedebokerense]